MTGHHVRILAVLLMLGWVSQARADLVVNGGFESGAVATSVVPGWTVTGNVDTYNSTAACCHTGDTGSGNFLLFGGGDGADNGVVTQTLTTIAGTDYLLTFSYGATSSPAGLGTQSITIGAGNLNTTVTSGPAAYDYSHVFVTNSFTFRASGPTTTLSFSDASTVTNSIDGLLDNVAVVATPEPASFALLGFGLFGTLCCARRRR